MKLSDKKRSQIVFFIATIFLLFCVYFLSGNSENIVFPVNSAQSFTPEITTPLTAPPESSAKLKTEFPEINKKAEKALSFVRQHSRIPSGQSFTVPKNLIENNLLKSTVWKIWPYTHVIKNENLTPTDTPLAKVSNLIIVGSSEKNNNLSEFNASSPVAVYDSRMKKAGIITGVIKVLTNDKAQLEYDLNQNRAHLTDSFDQINTYFITSTDEVFDLEFLYNTLKLNPAYKNVELEILSKSYEKF